jgi:hypothetical protein
MDPRVKPEGDGREKEPESDRRRRAPVGDYWLNIFRKRKYGDNGKGGVYADTRLCFDRIHRIVL